jgi:hypothetical protein
MNEMTELAGQLPLFTLDGADQEIQDQYADEECCCSYCAPSTQDIEYPHCRGEFKAEP